LLSAGSVHPLSKNINEATTVLWSIHAFLFRNMQMQRLLGGHHIEVLSQLWIHHFKILMRRFACLLED